MRNPEIWFFLFILGLFGLSWPVLEIFKAMVFPYLFIFWLFFIILVAIAARKSGNTLQRQK